MVRDPPLRHVSPQCLREPARSRLKAQQPCSGPWVTKRTPYGQPPPLQEFQQRTCPGSRQTLQGLFSSRSANTARPRAQTQFPQPDLLAGNTLASRNSPKGKSGIDAQPPPKKTMQHTLQLTAPIHAVSNFNSAFQETLPSSLSPPPHQHHCPAISYRCQPFKGTPLSSKTGAETIIGGTA